MPLRKTKKINGGYHSYGSGITCIASVDVEDESGAPRYFASRRADSPHYDKTLAELSTNLHGLLRQAHTARTDHKTRVGLLVTSHGLLPVWKIEYTEAELPEGIAGEQAVLLDDKSDAEVAAALGLDTEEGSSSRTPLSAVGRGQVFRLGVPTGDGGVDCVDPGNTCMIETLTAAASGAPRYFASQRRDAPNYDATLAELSDRLNRMVEQAYLARTDSSSRVGLLLTHRGLLPVWKRSATSAPGKVNSEGALEGKSDEEVTALLHLA
jgi:hypothetical protein